MKAEQQWNKAKQAILAFKGAGRRYQKRKQPWGGAKMRIRQGEDVRVNAYQEGMKREAPDNNRSKGYRCGHAVMPRHTTIGMKKEVHAMS